jgi:hypothetical protein
MMIEELNILIIMYNLILPLSATSLGSTVIYFCANSVSKHAFKFRERCLSFVNLSER